MVDDIDLQRLDISNIYIVKQLAHSIWHEYFPRNKVIGDDQVAYMLDKFYTESAIKEANDLNEIFYLIEHAKRYVGFFSFKFSDDESVLFLRRVFLDREYRDKGIFSRKIIKLLEKIARDKNAGQIKLYVNRRNKKAIEAYQHCGFLTTEEVDIKIGDDYVLEDQVMIKSLPFLTQD